MRTLISILGLLPPFLMGQFGAGVQGTVFDTAGGAVASASVTLINEETQRQQKTQSNGGGFYGFFGLAPGRYSLAIEKTGFRRQTVGNIQINAEQTQGRNVTLSPGDVSQTITVTESAAEVLQTENADVGKSITQEEVRELPQLGRDPFELLRTVPGVFGDGARGGGGSAITLGNTTGPGQSNYSIFQTENQVQISANGQRVSENNYEIDGVSVNSLGWGGSAVVTPNQESVKQMRVTSGSYSAEAGRNAGGQVNVISQNGSNQLHGSGVFKYDDPNFNAFNTYGGYGLPPTRVNQLYRQYAMSIGGPVVKNHLFYFFSYEGLRNNSVNYVNQWVDTSQYRQAVINARPNTFAAKVLSAPGEAPRVVGVANLPCPKSFAPGNCAQVAGGLDIGSIAGAAGNYVSSSTGGGLDGIPDIQFAQLASPSTVNANQYNGRVDYTHGKDNLALSMFFTSLNQTAASNPQGDRPIADLPFQPLNTAVTLTYTRVLSATLINEARANLTRFASNQLSAAKSANFQIPSTQIEGLGLSNILFGAPQGETTPSIMAQNTYEFRDSLSWVRGDHVLKGGVEVRKEQNNDDLLGGARPLYSFTGPWNLANSAPIFEQINLNPNTGGPADAQRYFRTSTYSIYLQDDWKVSHSLTVNLGLRWEYFTPLREKNGQLTNLQFGSDFLQDARVVPVGELYHADRHGFGPRFGFAFNPDRYAKNLVLRGGFGIFYNRPYGELFTNNAGNPPNFARYGICCGNASAPFDNGKILLALGATDSPLSFPVNPLLAQGINPKTGTPNSGGVEIWGAPNNLPNGYAYIYSFEVQYKMPGDYTFTAGYQGSTDHKLIRLVNQNFLYANNPAFTAIYFPTPDVNSNYNALNLSLLHSLAKGVQLTVNYRWAKSIDNLSYGGPGAVTNQTYPQNDATEKGPSDFDTKHNVLVSGLWELPLFQKSPGVAGKLFGGFRANGILQWHSGFPWTPVIGQSVNTPGGATLAPIRPTKYYGGAGTNSSVDAYVNGSNFPLGGAAYFDIGDSGAPGIGRNSFRGPNYFTIDLSLAKSIRIPNRYLGEATQFELRCNMFNALNNLNLSPITFGDNAAHADNPQFGRADAGLSGRVVELQFRLSF